MSSFNKKPFSQRYGALGDMAENAFERWCILHEHNYVRRGWDRPALSRFYQVHPLDRATPDFLLETQDTTCYVDCKGTAYDHVKIKQESIDGLLHWQEWHPVWLFVWNSKLKKHSFLNFELVQAASVAMLPSTFDDGKEYYEFSIDWDSPNADIR